MEDQNVIIFLDKIKKLLELGNKPKSIVEIESLIMLLEKSMNLKKGNRFKALGLEQMPPGHYKQYCDEVVQLNA